MIENNQLDDILAPGGVLSSAVDHYEDRVGQLEMARNIAHCYNSSYCGIFEAGTGIGKSFAYLSVALLNALEHPEERTVIATSTITLQKQLFDHDIPALEEACNVIVPYALMLGRSNYLCLRRLYENSAFADLFSQDQTTPEAQLATWAETTQTGVLDDYKGEYPKGVIRSDIASDFDLCLGAKCPHFNRCHFYKSKRLADNAKIIVTNHHLLFTDARQRFESGEGYDERFVLPSYNRLIIDECHNIDRNATSLFTRSFSYRDLAFQMRKLIRVKYGNERQSLLEAVTLLSKDTESYSRINTALQNATRIAERLNQHLLDFVKRPGELRIVSKYFVYLNEFVRLAMALSDELKQAVVAGLFLLERTDFSNGEEQKEKTFKSVIDHLSCFVDILRDFSSFDKWSDDVYYFSRKKVGKNITDSVSINIAPLEVATVLSKSIFSQLDTVICCSATLKVDNEFNYFKKQVGLDKRESITGFYESPFDFKSNLLLLLSQDAPQYSNQSENEYIERIIPKISEAITSSGGGALILFTSNLMMKACYERLNGTLDYRMMIQNPEVSRSVLLKEFKEDKDSVLFATQSFWEGVDAPGDTLRLVVITKLPFPQLNEPIFSARSEKIESEGRSSFRELSMPEMIMKLKQGFGRLLRSQEDRGVVYILDGRMNKWRNYILQQLPNSYFPEELMDESVPRHIENFLY
ncbi:MAG: ATP-dependent DNA helicase [Sphaerochaetaceae bacterium]|nr:ATP-dependent DNA helicase [Sphaerochaetaceae bacterium]